MIVRKLSEAKPYEAPNHRKYESLRIFGAEMGGSQALVFGLSHFQPGGGAGPCSRCGFLRVVSQSSRLPSRRRRGIWAGSVVTFYSGDRPETERPQFAKSRPRGPLTAASPLLRFPRAASKGRE